MPARRSLIALTMSAALVAGCGAPKNQVIADSADSAFFKIPRSWETYSIDVGVDNRLPPTFPEDVTAVWSTVFDADPVPSVDNAGLLSELKADELRHPAGRASVYAVGGTFLQRLSIASARESAIGFDPVAVPDDIKDQVEIIDYQPTAHDVLEGSRVVFNFRSSVNEPWQTYDVTTMFDQSIQRMYVLTIGCSAECFKTNSSRIFAVTDSWTVSK
jgi:hypothetical protein